MDSQLEHKTPRAFRSKEKRNNPTVNLISFCLLTKCEDVPSKDIPYWAHLLGVSTRTIYRYINKVVQVKFIWKDYIELWHGKQSI